MLYSLCIQVWASRYFQILKQKHVYLYPMSRTVFIHTPTPHAHAFPINYNFNNNKTNVIAVLIGKQYWSKPTILLRFK